LGYKLVQTMSVFPYLLAIIIVTLRDNLDTITDKKNTTILVYINNINLTLP